MPGFRLRRLTLSGDGVKDAELVFERGLNVVTGPSDTGKTYIAQCIDFVMGSSSKPEAIPEAAQHQRIFLEIESTDLGENFVLERSLSGGDIRVTGVVERILGPKHKAGNSDTVSSFLLDLCGLNGKSVRTNQQGKTRPVSFRDISKLVIVDEESVIRKMSPVLSGQYTARTAEGGVFRLLLSGIDDSSIIAKDDPKTAKAQRRGKVEVFEMLIHRTRDQLLATKATGSIDEIRDQLARLDFSVEQAIQEMTAEQNSAAAIEEARRLAWTRLRKIESRADVLSELQKRFELLGDQYRSDMRRLDAISEAGFRLAQMQEERCPVCGALAEFHAKEHQHVESAPSDVAVACKAEGEKLQRLLRDLQATLISNAEELDSLALDRNIRLAEFESANAELQTLLKPSLQLALQRVRELQAKRNECRERLAILERQQEYELLLAESSALGKMDRSSKSTAPVSTGEAEPFCKVVENILKAWQFPDLDRVTFSENDLDIVVSGRSRGSRGKGVRAITHTAFNLALLRLCANERRPFPGFVLIDSPLVVYREPDTDEGTFPRNVKDAFYRSVAKDFKDVQVIILENDDAIPPDVLSTSNVVAFTGKGHGRNGFIPR